MPIVLTQHTAAHGRFGAQATVLAVLMLVLSMACFAHTSASQHDDIGLVDLSPSIPSNTPIKLRTWDNQVLETTAAIVSRSSYITAFFTDDFSPATTEIPVPATAHVMTKVLTWLGYHQGQVFPPPDPRHRDSASDWDLEFCKAMSDETFMYMMNAAFKLKLWPLSNLGNFHIGNVLRGKSRAERDALFRLGMDWHVAIALIWVSLDTCCSVVLTCSYLPLTDRGGAVLRLALCLARSMPDSPPHPSELPEATP